MLLLLKCPPPSELRERQYVLEVYIENHGDLKKIAPGSLNTIRIVTLIDRKGQLHILAALLRMGNGLGHTDNYHDGGIACPINVETGKLGRLAFGMGCREYEIHPFSKIRFEGYPIPKFFECVELVKRLSMEEPEARYVGWDLAITPSGIELLEANIPPGEDITQLAMGHGIYQDILKLI